MASLAHQGCKHDIHLIGHLGEQVRRYWLWTCSAQNLTTSDTCNCSWLLPQKHPKGRHPGLPRTQEPSPRPPSVRWYLSSALPLLDLHSWPCTWPTGHWTSELHLDLMRVEHCPAKFKQELEWLTRPQVNGTKSTLATTAQKICFSGKVQVHTIPASNTRHPRQQFYSAGWMTPYTEEQPLEEAGARPIFNTFLPLTASMTHFTIAMARQSQTPMGHTHSATILGTGWIFTDWSL
jgi:hypothetical protein